MNCFSIAGNENAITIPQLIHHLARLRGQIIGTSMRQRRSQANAATFCLRLPACCCLRCVSNLTFYISGEAWIPIDTNASKAKQRASKLGWDAFGSQGLAFGAHRLCGAFAPACILYHRLASKPPPLCFQNQGFGLPIPKGFFAPYGAGGPWILHFSKVL